jgi:glycosyltransferase involved in cell wall biosynthesis
VVNVDGIEWERGKWSGLGKSVFRWGARSTARFADEIVCDSHAITDLWSRELGRAGVFIPYGAHLVFERPTHRIANWGLRSKSYGLIVARLTPENNIDLILDAIELLRSDIPFVVVGSVNYASPTVERLKRLSSERTNFSWLGHVDDQELLIDLWFHSGVYIHGHSVGGTNPALLQALGCGAPTLALDTPFNREVVKDERMLFPADASRLAELVLERLSGRGTALNSRTIIDERYRWVDCCSAYARLLSKTQNRNRRKGVVAAANRSACF